MSACETRSMATQMSESRIDGIVKRLHEIRSQTPIAYSADMWAAIKAGSPSGIAILREEAMKLSKRYA